MLGRPCWEGCFLNVPCNQHRDGQICSHQASWWVSLSDETPREISRRKKKYKNGEERRKERQLRKWGVVAFQYTINCQGYFGRERERKRKGQAVPAWSFCTSSRNAGEMMGLNKSTSENRKEIFPIALPVWRTSCLKHWPPRLSQCGQETDCHSYSDD